MKLITIQKIGYNSPSQANWSYSIYQLTFINVATRQQWSYTTKSTFGYADTLRNKYNDHIMELGAVYTSTGTPKITGVASMLDIDSKVVEGMINNFINNDTPLYK